MTDNLRESLSAFIDGEASEIEVHRLLRQYSESDGGWIRFQQIRTVVRGERTLSPENHAALRENIRDAIAAEEVYESAPGARRFGGGQYGRPAAAFGVAASLLVAVLVGFNMNRSIDGTAPEVAATSSQPITSQPIASQSVELPIETVAFDGAVAPVDESELKELDEETLRAVRAYLNQHDRSVRMQPVIYQQPEGK